MRHLLRSVLQSRHGYASLGYSTRTMCGIVAYLGPRPAPPILLEGLRRLEYRGYDSAGCALLEQGELVVCRRVGRVVDLER